MQMTFYQTRFDNIEILKVLHCQPELVEGGLVIIEFRFEWHRLRQCFWQGKAKQ
jgi:hypothetical protein